MCLFMILVLLLLNGFFMLQEERGAIALSEGDHCPYFCHWIECHIVLIQSRKTRWGRGE